MADKNLKSYFRYDGNGRIVPGSNILKRGKKPQNGNWTQVDSYECCNPTTTTTTTAFTPYIQQVGISSGTDVINACETTIDSVVYVQIQNPETITVGDQVYLDNIGIIPFTGNGEYYHFNMAALTANTWSAQVNSSGVIIGLITIC